MKTSLFRSIFAITITTVIIFTACGSESGTTGIPKPPSPDDLVDQGFLLPELPRVTCEQLKQWMDEGEPLLVVDTRIKFMFDQGHLPETINIPMIPDDEQTERFLVLPKDRKIIFYCD